VIDGLYVIKDGVCLYSRDPKADMEEKVIISGFLTAFNQFAKNIPKGGNIKQIVIGKMVMSFLLSRNLIFVFRQSELNSKALQVLSSEIIESFNDNFKSELGNFRGQTSLFANFDEEFDRIISKEISLSAQKISIEYVPADIETAIIEKLASNGYISEEDINRCKICLMEIFEGLEEKVSCPNNHPVHLDCLKHWLVHSNSCPVCQIKYPSSILNIFDKK